jgi:hypothetical protein
MIINFTNNQFEITHSCDADSIVNELCDELYEAYKDTDRTIHVGQELIILTFRSNIRLKKYDKSLIKFTYLGDEIVVDDEGSIRQWPKGFCNVQGEILKELFDI